jgi:hypothetical protein
MNFAVEMSVRRKHTCLRVITTGRITGKEKKEFLIQMLAWQEV